MAKIAVRYCTRTGHSKQLAESIAAALGLEAKDISEGLDEPVDQLFLCNGMYAAMLDRKLKDFLEISGKDAGEIINVCSSASGRSTRKALQKLVEETNVRQEQSIEEVSTLTMEIEGTVFLAVEVHPPLHQFANLLWRTAHHLLNGLAVADIVASNHCVLDVLLEIVDSQIGHRGHTTLCERSVGLVKACLTDKAYASPLLSILRRIVRRTEWRQRTSHLQGVAHAGHACSDNQKVILIDHSIKI